MWKQQISASRQEVSTGSVGSGSDRGCVGIEACPLARLRVVLALHRPSVLVLECLVLPRPEVGGGRVRAVWPHRVGAELAGGPVLDGTIGLDDRFLTEGFCAHRACLLQDLPHFLKGFRSGRIATTVSSRR